MGTALGKLGQYEEAERSLREAVRLAPGSADTLFALGNVLRAQGRIDDAIEAFRATHELEPNHHDARQTLDQAIARRGQ